jgi:hypothetical protein
LKRELEDCIDVVSPRWHLASLDQCGGARGEVSRTGISWYSLAGVTAFEPVFEILGEGGGKWSAEVT